MTTTNFLGGKKMFKALQFHGDRLRDKRKMLGITAKNLAKKVGLSEGYVSTLETGERNNPSVDVLNTLARELDFNAMYFFEDPLPVEYLPEMDKDLLQFLMDPNNKKWIAFAKSAKGSGFEFDVLKEFLDFMEMKRTSIENSPNPSVPPTRGDWLRKSIKGEGE
jgi:transcriptional regulator with XRE-family HTH domain